MAKRFRVILKGLDNNYTQLKTRLEHETLERFHHPKKKGLPEPLDIPAEQSKNNYLIHLYSFTYSRGLQKQSCL